MHALLIALVLSADLPVDASAVKAKAALMPFKKSLKEALTTAMEKSPESAIDVCSKDAPALATKFSTDGVKLGRSAFKLRNEKNAPADWVKQAMESLSKEKSGAEASRTDTLEGGRTGYAEAIWVGAQCLACAREPRLHRADRHAERERDFVVAQAIHLT